MAELIDLLATLTVHRDRERLDVALAQALMSLLRPHSIGVWRLVGDGDASHWLSCARMEQGVVTPYSDPPWVDLSALPRRESSPLRAACLTRQSQIAERDAAGHMLTAVPLPGEQDQPGVVEIVTTEALNADELRTLHAVLRVFGNFQSLLDYSQRDTLTGLLNRKTFDESFLKTAQISAGGSQGTLFGGDSRKAEAVVRYWLGVIDIDHFKSVNDRFGHLIGDEVLLLVARILRGTFRFQDRLFRFGGEEFVVMIRCADEAHALGAFERLRVNMENYPFPQVGQVTASIGFTEVFAGDTSSAAFGRADRAVYQAKQNGRNQVCSHAELVRRGALADGSAVGDVELF